MINGLKGHQLVPGIGQTGRIGRQFGQVFLSLREAHTFAKGKDTEGQQRTENTSNKHEANEHG